MKLNWFSPLQPAPTDIAHYTARVLPALSKRAEVTLWTDQKEWNEELEKYAEVRRFNPLHLKWEEFNCADISVYHIGNNPLFHGAIWRISRELPGLVVLHDLRLHHFFDGLYRVETRDLEGYLSVMEFYYGAEGRRDAAECFAADARNIDEMAERYPLTRHALEGAAGVLTHTLEAFKSLKDSGDYALAYAPLPFAAREQKERRERENSLDASSDENLAPLSLIIFGYIGRNRRLDAVLQALAEFPQRERFQLDVYGPILNDERSLRERIKSLGLKKLVHLHGFVDEAELDRALSQADLAINLRYPTMGEASGSQLRIWSHALPSLVTATGWYASLPPETVAHVRPEHEIADIQKHLKDFLTERACFKQMGESGRRLLEKEHSPEVYAESLLDFASVVQRFRTRAALLKLSARVGEDLSLWAGPAANDTTFNRIAAEIYEMIKG